MTDRETLYLLVSLGYDFSGENHSVGVTDSVTLYMLVSLGYNFSGENHSVGVTDSDTVCAGFIGLKLQ